MCASPHRLQPGSMARSCSASSVAKRARSPWYAIDQTSNDAIALAQLLDLVDHQDDWVVGLAVAEIEARGCTAPPCKPATDVAPAEMTMQ